MVNGKAGISPEMAVRLTETFSSTLEMGLRLQMAYNLTHVRRQKISVKPIARCALRDDLQP